MPPLYLTLLFLLLLATSVLVIIYFFIFLYPLIGGAPYVPSKISDVEDMLALADIKPGELTADLGSGDGRMVFAMAKKGAIAHGYEISPVSVFWSNLMRKRLPRDIASKTSFYVKSFWDIDLSKYDVIFLYQLPYVMKRLEKKLSTELKPRARIVCNGFSIPGWKPSKETSRLYMYVK